MHRILPLLAERARAGRQQDASELASVLICGPVGGGKTSFGAQLSEQLRALGFTTGGILAPRILDGDRTTGYQVRDIASGREHPLAALQPPGEKVGRYYVKHEGVRFAARAIRRSQERCDVVFVDEVGQLELRGGGHAAAVHELLGCGPLAVLVVRDSLRQQVCRAFGIGRAVVLPVERNDVLR